MKKTFRKGIVISLMLIVLLLCLSVQAYAANPFMAQWERIPDGEPRIFIDPETGLERMYVYGSHDTFSSGYCGTDHVVWSAPVDDLTEWRHDGVAFEISQLNGLQITLENGTQKTVNVGSERLWAPDVVYHPQLDRYYMFVFLSSSHHVFVAESETPEGPFTNPRYVGQGFDPAVLVDDVKDENGNQRVYMYYSGGNERAAYACELDPVTMQKIDGTLHVPVDHSTAVDGNDTMPHRNMDPFYFFEGPSIRKVDDTYVLTYAKTDAGSGNGKLAEIGYCISDNPYGDPKLGSEWEFGGVVVDNKGEVVENPYSPGSKTSTYKGGNNHGGMIEVNGQWYQVYHRATGVSISRQAMAEPINLHYVDGKLVIDQAEVTSQGFEINGLDPYESQYAASACWGLGSYTFDINANLNFDPDAEREDWYPVTNLKNQSWLGYKYFNFGEGISENESMNLILSLKEYASGTVKVYAADAKEKYSDPEKPRTLIGSMALSGTNAEEHEITIPVKALSGTKAIYLEFLSENTSTICALNKLRFSVGDPVYADNLYLDGSELTGFDPYTFNYYVTVESLDKLPKVTALADEGLAVEITQATTEAPAAVVEITLKKQTTTYTVNFLEPDLPTSWDFTKTDKETLLSEWEIINPANDNWSIDEEGLHLDVLPGDLINNTNTAKNVFTLNSPGNWIMDTKVTFNKAPSKLYHQAVIMGFQDVNNYVKLSYEYGVHTMGDRAQKSYVQFAQESGAVMTQSFQNPESVQSIYYRLKKVDNVYTAFYSTDGETYTEMGSYTANYATPKVALTAFNGKTYTDDLVATFEYLNYSPLPEEPKCTCALYDLQAEDAFLPIPAGADHAEYELNASVSTRGGCLVPGHKDAEPTITYALSKAVANTAEASLNGNVLTASKAGTVGVVVTASRNDAEPITREIILKVGPQDVPTSWDFTKTDKETLLGAWSIINPANDNWSIDENGLHLDVLPGDLFNKTNSAKNIFTLDAPGDWIMDTKVTFNAAPSKLYHQGVVMGFQDVDNYVKLSYEFGVHTMGDSKQKSYVQFAQESNATLTQSFQNPESVQEIYCRLQKVDDVYTAYYSTDGKSFTQMGSYTASYANPKVALAAFNGKSFTDDLVATFEYVNFSSLPKCTCALGELQAEEALLKIPMEADSVEHELSASVSTRGSCAIPGHKDAEPTLTFSLTPDTPNTVEAVIDGDLLTVSKAGTVSVRVTAAWNEAETVSRDFVLTVEKLGLPSNWDFTKTNKETLLGGWEIINPANDNWSIDEKGLHLDVLPGDLYQTNNSAKNIFTLDAPGNWVMDTKVSFNKAPSKLYHQGVVMGFQDVNNYVKLSYEYGVHTMGDNKQKSYVQFAQESDAVLTQSFQNPETVQEIYYRLQKLGDVYTAYYSTDGENYTKMGSYTASYAEPKVALAAFNGKSFTDDLVATFEYVKFSAVPKCSCELYELQAEDGLLRIPADADSADYVLTASVSARGDCRVHGHKDAEPTFTYTLPENGENTAEATIDGNVLTAGKEGSVTVRVTAVWNDAKAISRDFVVTVEKISAAEEAAKAAQAAQAAAEDAQAAAEAAQAEAEAAQAAAEAAAASTAADKAAAEAAAAQADAAKAQAEAAKTAAETAKTQAQVAAEAAEASNAAAAAEAVKAAAEAAKAAEEAKNAAASASTAAGSAADAAEAAEAAQTAQAAAEAAQKAAEEAAASAAEDKAAAETAQAAAELAQTQAEAAKAAAEEAKAAADASAKAAAASNTAAAEEAAKAAEEAKNAAASASTAAGSAADAAEAAEAAQTAQAAAEAAQKAAEEAAASAADDKTAAEAAQAAAELAKGQAEAAKAAAEEAKAAADASAKAAAASNTAAAEEAAKAAEEAKNAAASASTAAGSAADAAEAAEAAQTAQAAAEAAQKAAEEAAASAADDKTAAEAAQTNAELAKAQAVAAKAAAEAAQNAAEIAAAAAKEANAEAAGEAAAAAGSAKASTESAAAAAASAKTAAEAAKAAQDAQARVEEAEKNVAADKAAVEQAKKEAEEAARKAAADKAAAEKAAAEAALSVARYNALVELNEYADSLKEAATKTELAALSAAVKAAREAVNGAADEAAAAQALEEGIAALDKALCMAKNFADVDLDAWYHDAVDFVLKEGIMNGTGNGSFAPTQSLTRAMLVQILYNIEGRPAYETELSFSDVAEDAWYYDAVMWAAENGIVLGTGNGAFAPDANITREQMVTILYRYAGEPEVTAQDIVFADSDEISDWAKDAVLWAYENKLVQGVGNGLFVPAGDSQRAAAAQIMMNYFKK